VKLDRDVLSAVVSRGVDSTCSVAGSSWIVYPRVGGSSGCGLLRPRCGESCLDDSDKDSTEERPESYPLAGRRTSVAGSSLYKENGSTGPCGLMLEKRRSTVCLVSVSTFSAVGDFGMLSG
jgi:hypothetical protein